MARGNQLSYLMMQKLTEQYENGKGKSKHEYKKETTRRIKMANKRAAKGLEHEDPKKIDAAKNLIFSQSTYDSYKRWCKNYCKFIKENYGISRMSIEDSKQYLDAYIGYMTEKGYSPYSIHLAASAVCKATGEYLRDHPCPKRNTKIMRSSNEREVAHDKYNANNPVYKANLILGLRRGALGRLCAKDIVLVTDDKGEPIRAEVRVKSKGGKLNIQTFYPEYEDEFAFVLSLREGKQPEERIFDKTKFGDIDLHDARKRRAQDVYERVVSEIENNPERKQWYIEETKRMYYRDKKKELTIDLDKEIHTRGTHKKILQEQGVDVTFSKLACLFVSESSLAHSRHAVSQYFYIAKP